MRLLQHVLIALPQVPALQATIAEQAKEIDKLTGERDEAQKRSHEYKLEADEASLQLRQAQMMIDTNRNAARATW